MILTILIIWMLSIKGCGINNFVKINWKLPGNEIVSLIFLKKKEKHVKKNLVLTCVVLLFTVIISGSDTWLTVFSTYRYKNITCLKIPWSFLFYDNYIYLVIGFDCTKYESFNSWAPGRSECDSKNGIFNLVLLIGIFRCSHDNALPWIPQDLTDDKSALV